MISICDRILEKFKCVDDVDLRRYNDRYWVKWKSKAGVHIHTNEIRNNTILGYMKLTIPEDTLGCGIIEYTIGIRNVCLLSAIAWLIEGSDDIHILQTLFHKLVGHDIKSLRDGPFTPFEVMMNSQFRMEVLHVDNICDLVEGLYLSLIHI